MPRLIASCTVLTAVLAATAAVALASCGMSTHAPTSGDTLKAGSAVQRPSLPDLYAQTKAATLGASSVRVRSDTVENGTKMSYDVAGRVDGTNLRIRRATEGQGTVE